MVVAMMREVFVLAMSTGAVTTTLARDRLARRRPREVQERLSPTNSSVLLLRDHSDGRAVLVHDHGYLNLTRKGVVSVGLQVQQEGRRAERGRSSAATGRGADARAIIVDARAVDPSADLEPRRLRIRRDDGREQPRTGADVHGDDARSGVTARAGGGVPIARTAARAEIRSSRRATQPWRSRDVLLYGQRR